MKTLCSDLLIQEMMLPRQGTLSQHLYHAIKTAILSHRFNPNMAMPASRILAKELKISRNTVLTAYEQLITEGYLYSHTGKGTFVVELLKDQYSQHKNINQNANNHAILKNDHLKNEHEINIPSCELSNRGNTLLEHAFAAPIQWGAFTPGVPDVTIFPHHRFSKIQSKINRSPDYKLLTYRTESDSLALREALVDHLKLTRAIECNPDQILLTEGTHQAIDLISKVLCDVGDLVWIEEPGYWGIRSVLRINGLLMQPILVDSEGMHADYRNMHTPPKLIFVTPSHQYPLGTVMSLTRRLQLISLARHLNSWIIEDDYDSEFRFSGQPIPALYSLEKSAPVIYLGTFSKTIYPALRMSYLVLPQQLVDQLKRAHSELYRGGRLLIQATLAQFMKQGFYAAHIRAMRLLYGKRRTQLMNLIKDNLGEEYLDISAHNAGLHLILRLPKSYNDVEIAAKIFEDGIIVRPLSRYYLNPTDQRGLLMGYASVPENIMPNAFAIVLKHVTRHLL